MSIFCKQNEASASKLLENLPYYHMDSDVISRSKSSATHWCMSCREKVKSLPFTSKYIFQTGFRYDMIFTPEPVVLMLTNETRIMTRISCSTVIDNRIERVSERRRQ